MALLFSDGPAVTPAVKSFTVMGMRNGVRRVRQHMKSPGNILQHTLHL